MVRGMLFHLGRFVYTPSPPTRIIFMTSLDRMLGILDLFSEDQSSIQSDDVIALINCSRATAYRYLRSLCASGILAQAPEGRYVLGSRIIEFDRLLRKTDPLLTSASPVMDEVSKRLNLNMMLCSYYHDRVMCVDTAWPDKTTELTYERGRPMPMFFGARAKAILAHLSPYQIRNLMLEHSDEIKAAGLGNNWKEFRGALNKIRREGTCYSYAEVMPDLIGVAAPVFDAEDRVLGSIVFVVTPDRLQTVGEAYLREQIAIAAQRITANTEKQ